MALAVIASLSLSSCLKTEEPEGIENIRNAKAELIKAQAQYKIAEIALVEADVQMKNTTAEGMDLDNQLAELDYQAAQLELQMREAEIEHQKKLWELDEALAQKENEVEIARLQNELFQLEVDKIQMELDKLKAEQEKELAIKNHEAALIAAQQKVDEAEAEYELALRKIAAASQGLTQEEADKLEAYKTTLDDLREKINQAELDLIDAQKNFIDAKYNYDIDALRYKYQNEITLKEREVKNAEDLLAEAKALDLNGNAQGWLDQKAEIETEKEALEAEVDKLNLAIAEKELEKEAPETEKRKLDDQYNELQNQIDALGEEYNSIYDRIYNGRFDLSIEFPEAIAKDAVMTTDLYNEVFSYYESTDPYDDNAIIKGFERVVNEYGVQYMLTGTTVEWNATYEQNNEIIQNLENFIGNILMTNVSLEEMKEYLENEKYNFTNSRGDKTLYEKYLKIFEEGRSEYESLAAEYGIKFGEYTENNLLTAANAALEKLRESLTPTDAELETWIEAIRKEQEIRHKLANAAVAGWEKFTVENYKLADGEADKVTFADLQNAVNNSNGYSIEYYNYVDVWEESKWSATQKWYEGSQFAFNLAFLRKAITEETFENTLVFVYDDSYNYQVLYNDRLANILFDLGYGNSGYNYDPDGRMILDNFQFTNSLWYLNITTERRLALLQNVIDNNALYKEVALDIAELNQKNGPTAEDNERLLEIMTEVRALIQQQNDLIPMVEAQDKIIREIELQASAMYDEINIINTHIGRLDAVIATLDGLISNEEIVIDGVTYRPGDENIETEYAAWITKLEDKVTEAKENLRIAQADLERLENEEDPAKYIYDKAVKEYEQAEAEYQRLLDQFNFYNDLLDEFLNQIIG